MGKAPRVCENGDGSQSIDLGWVIKIILGLAIASFIGTVAGVPLLSYDVAAQEEKIAAIETAQKEKIKIIEAAQSAIARNQVVIDEQVRNLKADSDWTQLKLNALLEANNVTKRINRPSVSDSKLEKPE